MEMRDITANDVTIGMVMIGWDDDTQTNINVTVTEVSKSDEGGVRIKFDDGTDYECDGVDPLACYVTE